MTKYKFYNTMYLKFLIKYLSCQYVSPIQIKIHPRQLPNNNIPVGSNVVAPKVGGILILGVSHLPNPFFTDNRH